MRSRLLTCLLALVLTVLSSLMLIHHTPALPSALETPKPRELLRIWLLDAPGGATVWLKKQLQAFEKQRPGVMTYLRSVSATELTRPDTVLPDLVLYMPGTVTEPEDLFAPLSGAAHIREPLLRSGRWKGEQYALPLCYSGYVLCIDSAYELQVAATPAPTALLGRNAASPTASAAPEPYPLQAVLQSDTPLLASGAGLFTLACLLEPEARPSLAGSTITQDDLYTRFRSRKAASALLTTGQYTALSSLTASGKGFSFRAMVPGEVVTDQVLAGSVLRASHASGAADLLAFLTGEEAQKALTSQNLHTVRTGMRLYFSGVEGEVESAAARSLTAINAFIPAQEAASAAWQCYTGQTGLNEALLPLL